jgi:large subunit ribosomal protein L35
MPKMKTHSGAKKRFSLTGTGKVKRKHAFKSHILTKKTTKAKRALTQAGLVDQTDLPRVKAMLTIGK